MGSQFTEGQFLTNLKCEPSWRLSGQALISDSRLGKTHNDTFKVMQKERHTYSFDSQKRKPLNISHTGRLWPRTTANQDLTLCFASEVCHPQLAWGLERKPADMLFWLWGMLGTNMDKSQSGSAKPVKNRVYLRGGCARKLKQEMTAVTRGSSCSNATEGLKSGRRQLVPQPPL